MNDRLGLQALLESILGTRNVYFQPPENVKMQYPCIVYERDDLQVFSANGAPYIVVPRYKVTVIDKDPDSTIPGTISRLPMTSFDRHYTKDNLNHDVYNIYY